MTPKDHSNKALPDLPHDATSDTMSNPSTENRTINFSRPYCSLDLKAGAPTIDDCDSQATNSTRLNCSTMSLGEGASASLGGGNRHDFETSQRRRRLSLHRPQILLPVGHEDTKSRFLSATSAEDDSATRRQNPLGRWLLNQASQDLQHTPDESITAEEATATKCSLRGELICTEMDENGMLSYTNRPEAGKTKW